MTEQDLSISQLTPLPLPMQGTDLIHIGRDGQDYRVLKSELTKMFLSQLQDSNVTGAVTGHTLIFNSVTGKWENGLLSWAQITDKPVQFSPIAHTHLWGEIADTPTSFPPDDHTHAWSELTDVPSAFNPAAHTHGWTDITGKPTEFPPEAHTHADLYFSKAELNTSGAGGQVHWDNITDKPMVFGIGDMSKSVYDQDEDGVVDAASSVPWSGVTGKPGTFPADPHNHDASYSLLAHNHDSAYSVITHDHDNAYSALGHTHAGYLTDAPSDGVFYTRKDGGWVAVESGGGEWGSITGLLADQTDLQNALNAKANNTHNHDSAYAPVTSGVTNGNSHDHNGGDGAQIDHVNLANKGTNTHADIDAHLAASAPHAGHAALVHNHAGVYEPANANIQSHIGASAPHAGHAPLSHDHALISGKADGASKLYSVNEPTWYLTNTWTGSHWYLTTAGHGSPVRVGYADQAWLAYGLQCATVYHSAAQAIGHNTWTTITFNTDLTDPYNWHDHIGSPASIWLPAGGEYHILCQNFEFAAHATGARGVRVKDNGNNLWSYNMVPAINGLATPVMLVTQRVQSASYIYVEVYQSSGTTLNLSAFCKVSVIKVG